MEHATSPSTSASPASGAGGHPETAATPGPESVAGSGSSGLSGPSDVSGASASSGLSASGPASAAEGVGAGPAATTASTAPADGAGPIDGAAAADGAGPVAGTAPAAGAGAVDGAAAGAGSTAATAIGAVADGAGLGDGGAPSAESAVNGAPAGGAPAGGAAPADGASAEGAGSSSARLNRREGRSPRDMIFSLAILLIPIALLLGFYRLVLDGDAPVTTDPAPKIQEAQQSGAFTVVVPTGLGDDWSVSSATWTKAANGSTLRLGYVDPGKDPVQLIESSVPSATLLPAELTGTAKPLMTSFRSEAGVWRYYDGRPGERALVLADQTRTIVIVGKTNQSNLEKLAASLH